MTDTKVASFACGDSHGGVIAISRTTWQFLKPMLVGWLKEKECYFSSLPLSLLQYIIELSCGYKLPELKFPASQLEMYAYIHDVLKLGDLIHEDR